jgi:hypothetical protein
MDMDQIIISKAAPTTYFERVLSLFRGIASVLARVERRWNDHRPAWAASIAAMLFIQIIVYRSAANNDWYAGGRDMADILPELRSSGGSGPLAWLTGPWAGYRIFSYYRPITSLAMFAQFRLFGEHAFSWQVVSLLLHMASSVVFILLVRQLSGSSLAALLGGTSWAFRGRMELAIAWTPAQTDLFAGLFSLICLFAVAKYLQGCGLRWGVASILFGLFALGSKEVALILPGLTTIIAIYFARAGRRRAAVIVGSWVILALFLVWRYHCLSGLGYLPVLASHGNKPASPPWGTYLNMWIRFLLPEPLGPATILSSVGVWLFSIASIAALRLASLRSRAWVAVAVVGFIPLTLLMDSWAEWMNLETYEILIGAIVWTFALAVAVKWKRAFLAATIAWGAVAWLPVSHTVYNACGNVTYLPDTYWGLLWACITAGLLAAVAALTPASEVAPAEVESAPV